MTLTLLLAAHKHSSLHRAEIEKSDGCACFHCLSTFAPSAITEWIDWPLDTPEEQQAEAGKTAMCPECGIDAVIGSASGYPLTHQFLVEMQAYWFET